MESIKEPDHCARVAGRQPLKFFLGNGNVFPQLAINQSLQSVDAGQKKFF